MKYSQNSSRIPSKVGLCLCVILVEMDRRVSCGTRIPEIPSLSRRYSKLRTESQLREMDEPSNYDVLT